MRKGNNMKNSDPIESIVRRTQRTWFEDGIWDIAFGITNLLIAAYSGVTLWFNLEGNIGMALALLQMLVIVGAFLSMRWVVTRLKQRFTFPRTGFVTYRKPTGAARWKNAIRSGLIAAFTGGMIALVSQISATHALLPTISSGLFALSFVYLAIRFDILRYFAEAVLSLALGLGITLLRLENALSMVAVFGGLGAICLFSGGLTLWRFIHNTQPATEQDMGGVDR
jgi:hypothetical protein